MTDKGGAGHDPNRRALLKGLGVLPLRSLFASPSAAQATRSPGRSRTRAVVVGAGAFGGWSALHLLRRGAQVTLLDAWGPGNSRSSSGGDTRVIRGVYGPHRVYVDMSLRSLQLWVEEEKRLNRRLYRQTGALWMVTSEDDSYVKLAMPRLREAGLPFDELTSAQARSRYPQVSFEGVRWALFEQRAGYLLARRACEAVVDGFLAEKGEYRQLSVQPGSVAGGEMREVTLSDGSRLSADVFIFACGPWLGPLFPDVVGDRIKPTRQEVFFFGTKPGDPRFLEDQLPVWVDLGPRLVYGIPGSERRGFKLADDTAGPIFDPTSGERVASPEGLTWARGFLAMRFPEMKGAPLLESRVCQYESSPDHHFIIDRHPAASNVWLVGGGSGHGFKMGPGVGERVARLALGESKVDPFFALSRHGKP